MIDLRIGDEIFYENDYWMIHDMLDDVLRVENLKGEVIEVFKSEVK
jgi:hypothetical protein